MAKNTFAYIVNKSGMTLLLKNRQFVIPTDAVNFKTILEAARKKNWIQVESLIDVKTLISNWGKGQEGFTNHGGIIYFNGYAFPSSVSTKILAMIREGNSPDALYNFLRKAYDNPNPTARDELFLFCEANGFMIHEDGDIIAYKSVRGDYKDIYSGTVLNTVGTTVSMDRTLVNKDRNQTCSTGFHFAAYDYASTWAGKIDGVNRRLLVMKINPYNVVAIPNDYNNKKARCCEYEIVSELITGNALPVKQVYSNADIGKDSSTLKGGQNVVKKTKYDDTEVWYDDYVYRWRRKDTGAFVSANDINF